METILNYLDNMFVNMPRTPEVIRAKEDLAEMMEDKYNELIAEGRMQNEAIGIVISEFGNIQELIDELGIQKESFTEKTEQDKNREKKDPNGQNTAESSVRQEEALKEPLEKETIRRDTYEKAAYEEEPLKKEPSEKEPLEKDPSEKDPSGKASSGKASFSEDDFRKQEKHGKAKGTKDMRQVSDLEADEYLFTVKQASSQLAAGVFLCICSPVLLILLAGIREFLFRISEGIVVGFGVTVLLCMVACAVALFITAGMKVEAYEYLKKECFMLDPVYEQSVRNIWEMQRKSKVTFKITAGVVLCILSVVPVIVCAVIITESSKNEFPILVSVAFLLVLVGIAVSMFITGGMEEEAYKIILQEKEFSVRKKSGKKVEDLIAAIYWPFVVIAYLVWSFMSGAWGITWIIWPVAGILYDVVCKAIDYAAHEK